jgi:hypothetical protein
MPSRRNVCRAGVLIASFSLLAGYVYFDSQRTYPRVKASSKMRPLGPAISAATQAGMQPAPGSHEPSPGVRLMPGSKVKAPLMAMESGDRLEITFDRWFVPTVRRLPAVRRHDAVVLPDDK